MVHGIQEYWAWPFTFMFLINLIKYQIYGWRPGSSLGVLGLGNKTSVSNIEIGFSISFVSAETMHDMWIFEEN